MGRILIILVVIVLVVAGVGFFALPSTASRSETFTVERPADTVFARLASTPPGTAIAEGVTQNEIVSAENNVVVANVAYADGATGTATYTVTPQATGAQVELKLEQALGSNPLNRLQGLTGGDVGPLVETAATSLNADLTALPAASFTGLAYDVVQLQPQPFFFIQNCSPSDPESVTSIVTQAVAAIPPIMRANGLAPSGPLMAVEPRVVSGQYCFQVGYPYTGRQPRALLTGQTGQTPSGTMLHVHYTGSEADVLTQVYNPMDALLAGARLDNPGTADDDWTTFEVYNDDPTQAGGSRNREIYYVTQGDIARLTAILPPSAAAPAPLAQPAATPPAATPPAATTPPADTTPAPATPAPAPTP